MHGRKPRRQAFSCWCPFISLLKFTCFLIVLNKRTISGDKVCFKRFDCRYMSSVSLTERFMPVLLDVFRYSYSSSARSNSTQDFSVPQRSSGVKKPEQRSVSHRLGPYFITMKPKIWGLSPLRKIAQPKSRKTCANRTLPKLCLDICKKSMLKKKSENRDTLKNVFVQHLGFSLAKG